MTFSTKIIDNISSINYFLFHSSVLNKTKKEKKPFLFQILFMSTVVTGTSETDINFKVILIGDERTGKSNLFERFKEYGKWDGTNHQRLGSSFSKQQ